MYVITIKSCPCVINLKNNAIIKLSCTNYTHGPKLTENVQNVLTGLKRCVLTGVHQATDKIYKEEVKKSL